MSRELTVQVDLERGDRVEKEGHVLVLVSNTIFDFLIFIRGPLTAAPANLKIKEKEKEKETK